MSLLIEAINLYRAPARAVASPLGSEVPEIYKHLLGPSGSFSRPPAAPVWADQWQAPDYALPVEASERCSGEMAEVAARALAAALPEGTVATAGGVLHCQATLSQSIVASNCLRVKNSCSPKSRVVQALSQLGVGAVPAALALSAAYLSGPLLGGRVLLSASDKWIQPFFRGYADLVNFGDAAGAVLISAPAEDRQGIAKVVGWKHLLAADTTPIWQQPRQRLADLLVDGVLKVALPLLERAQAEEHPVELIIGEPLAEDVVTRIAQALAAPSDNTGVSQRAHLSSAEALNGLLTGVRHANRLGRPVRVLIWTASMPGVFGALLADCYPAQLDDDGELCLAKPLTRH
ncbi:hypothetical protein [Parachitinimonas caeni]|uniref:Uncharacterized protein n=1 Tax=Parachitinimonas caeni TaxID=3031301 RepID=A0ABT7E0V0_9NEIS|nr:hypothetical protein [Parachitinimonas caeni]MDK2125938.1 hypothetical protein [Parachitinimonas caeni]